MDGLQNTQYSQNVEAVVNGIRIVYDQMLGVLRLHGVEQIKALGEKFNPVLHEAMLSKNEPDKDNDIVLEEYKKGYRLNSRVIRPSKVVVNKHSPQQALGQPQEQEIEKPAEQTQDTGDFETTDTQ
jgi:molecular chaperone GrpE